MTRKHKWARHSGGKIRLYPPLRKEDEPLGRNERLLVKEANIVPLVKGEAEEDFGPNG